MRIVFFCGSLEPGRDGVGDYTRRLAGWLSSAGHSVAILALNDKYILSTTSAVQQQGTDQIEVLRIPAALAWKETRGLSEQFLKEFKPDWISLQYVSYAYHIKGIPYKMLQAFLEVFNAYKLQVMFHELWLGEKKTDPLTYKIYGLLQKRAILYLINKANPLVLQTSIPLYQRILQNNQIKADLLPVFSNIPDLNLEFDAYADEIPDWLRLHRNDYIIGCNFGSFYESSWDLSSLLGPFVAECKKLGKQPLLFSIGKISAGEKEWANLAESHPDIQFLTLGMASSGLISYCLTHFADFGILTTPAFMAGKSGSFMAFKAHGLRSFCKENDLSYSFDLQFIGYDSSLIPLRSAADFYIPKREMAANQLGETASLFINALNLSN